MAPATEAVKNDMLTQMIATISAFKAASLDLAEAGLRGGGVFAEARLELWEVTRP